MIRGITLLLLSLSLAAIADPLDEERIWTGKNGQKIRGKYGRVSEDGQWLDLMVMGEYRRIAISNFSPEDQAFIRSTRSGTAENPAPPANPAGNPDAFKTPNPPDRDTLPLLNQGEHGQKQSDCVPSSICNFLLWWDQTGYLPIPKRGEFADKAEWVHTRMARYCGTRNTAGTDTSSAFEGIRDYFTKELADVATFQAKIDHDLRPQNLARYTQGPNATMLEVTTRKNNGADGGHWVALMKAEDDGRVVLHTWGVRIEGTLKVLEEDKATVTVNRQTVPKTGYEIEFTNRDSLPEWVKDAGMRFLLFPARNDGIIVMKPYLYAVPGKRSAPPPDPLFSGDTATPFSDIR